MILSASRRTDIPNYYSEWFFNRIKEGYVYVRNPINIHQVSEIVLSKELVDCIVFWTKNPEPMLSRLAELKDYSYYFQFTLTGYGKDIEPNLPHKREHMIPIFQKLSQTIGTKRVVWRYDPIIFTNTYTMAYHIKAFGEIADKLNGYCNRVVISFVDYYAKIKRNWNVMNIRDLEPSALFDFSIALAKIAKQNGMEIESCAEALDLTAYGIKKSSCIDKALIEQIIGIPLQIKKDMNQRSECGCVESIDIGAYNTCFNGCKYCYANYSEVRANTSRSLYDVHAPILCSKIAETDKISRREIYSNKMFKTAKSN